MNCEDLEGERDVTPFAWIEANNKKRKAIPVTGPGGPEGCKTSRCPHFVGNRHTDGGEVSLTRRPPLTRRKIPGTHFC
jgi:hypothetical protein